MPTFYVYNTKLMLRTVVRCSCLILDIHSQENTDKIYFVSLTTYSVEMERTTSAEACMNFVGNKEVTVKS